MVGSFCVQSGEPQVMPEAAAGSTDLLHGWSFLGGRGEASEMGAKCREEAAVKCGSVSSSVGQKDGMHGCLWR